MRSTWILKGRRQEVTPGQNERNHLRRLGVGHRSLVLLRRYGADSRSNRDPDDDGLVTCVELTASVDVLNLFGAEIHKALQSLLAQAETDDELRVLVVDTANPDYYIAHFDMLGGDDVLAIKTASRLPVWPDSASRMSRLDVITVASIRGRARGIGSEFVLACDIRFASREKAVLGQPEVSVGVIPGGGALDRLPGFVGRGRALEIVAGADDFDAELAERYGWVNRAVPDAELDAFVDNFADRLASFDKKALAKAKFIINDRQPVPTAGKLAESEAAFFETTTWPSTQQRVAAAFERGLQAPGPFEDNLGAAQANLGAELGNSLRRFPR